MGSRHECHELGVVDEEFGTGSKRGDALVGDGLLIEANDDLRDGRTPGIRGGCRWRKSRPGQRTGRS
jgi:hypothetical protein